MNSPSTPVWLNPAQYAIIKQFANGDFAYLSECQSEEAWRKELDLCGDGLLHFLLVELSGREDCDSGNEAVRRIRTSIRDLEDALAVVESLAQWEQPQQQYVSTHQDKPS
ncbi:MULTISPECIES: hypothetical protein [Burkholderia]|uniref:Uncharacterized protein n=1 Tax=Burkholderia pseudomultivorans TaxID=1207504 RepID=A0ABU2EC78_9BURK|nr:MULTISPECIES: hypothetical protein [Burkholderia]MBR8428983.1 hypothetical protein [Burkholderia cenocepacia]MDN7669356.1 hypothetical protein [Burkholderia vietnamiensis]MDR8731198.1 hypothetical protein [Burkholderia pseudomultivorans]MDR8738713.1 hypothetical protein [Burkholderia pseudomultivorans]MDR8745374.1 hypothetical protein [Burkholderia pseudomultivorans]